MAAHGLGFGYRVAEEVVRYHAFAAVHLKADAAGVTDDLMVQKVLVKLRGGERQRPLLTGLIKALDGLPRSQTFSPSWPPISMSSAPFKPAGEGPRHDGPAHAQRDNGRGMAGVA